MNRPNLFDFATSELSQDAFICWLASWANPTLKEENPSLHATATAFLDRLLAIGKGPHVAEYRSIEVHRQWNDIDVLLVVNGDTAIIIEDKTDTKDHSGQLEKYKRAVANVYPKDRIAAVYLKTGDQGNYQGVDQAGYGRFLRRPVGTAARVMYDNSFSQLPVHDGAKLVGLLTGETIARWLATRLEGGVGILEEEPVDKVLKHQEAAGFVLLARTATVFDGLNEFDQSLHSGRALQAVIVNANGQATDTPLGIVTVFDIPGLVRAAEP